VPKERQSPENFDYKGREFLNHSQLHYNTYDVWTPIALAILKVISVVEANPEFSGAPLDRPLLDACLAEDRAKKVLDYNQSGAKSGKPNLNVNSVQREKQPCFPLLAGQTSPTARYGRYMGSPKEDMLDVGTAKFDSQEYLQSQLAEQARLLAAQVAEAGAMWDAVRAAPSGGTSATSNAPDAAAAVAEWCLEEDEEDLNRYDYLKDAEVVPWKDIEEGEVVADVAPPPALLLGPEVPVDEPFWKYILPKELEKASTADKWAFIKSERDKSRPRIGRGRSWETDSKMVAKAHCPVFPDRCLTCGEKYHSSVDRFFCDETKAHCSYPLCYPGNGVIQGKHNIKVCMTLQFGCNDCRMRGHHPSKCPGNTPAALEETRRVFELYADQGVNTRRRRHNGYYGPIYMNFKCFKKIDCPWSHTFVMGRSVPEFMDIMLQTVQSLSGPANH
jgi:hypothetical protein